MTFRNDDDFDSESYVKVNVRLMEFWAKYPQGRVETEATIVNSGLIVKAKLYRDAQSTLPLATGHAFLEDMTGDKVGEYTETVAVGRALALAGFQVEKGLASGEEMSRFHQRKNDKAEAAAEAKAEAPRESKIRASGNAGGSGGGPVAAVPHTSGGVGGSAGTPSTPSDQPEVPKTLKTARIFKPMSKEKQT